jgi:hypothetical protein
MHNTQHCDTVIYIGPNLNIPLNTTDCFRLNLFFATLYLHTLFNNLA